MLRRHKPFKATVDYLLKPEKMGFSSIVDYPLTISRGLLGFCWLGVQTCLALSCKIINTLHYILEWRYVLQGAR